MNSNLSTNMGRSSAKKSTKKRLQLDDFDQLVLETSQEICSVADLGQNQQQQLTEYSDNIDFKNIGDTNSDCLIEVTQPKRPMNAFMVWAQVIRRCLHQRFSNVQNASLSKALGRVWRTMDTTTKEPFIRRADMIKAKHKRDYPDYRYQPRRILERKFRTNKLCFGTNLARHSMNEVRNISQNKIASIINDPSSATVATTTMTTMMKLPQSNHNMCHGANYFSVKRPEVVYPSIPVISTVEPPAQKDNHDARGLFNSTLPMENRQEQVLATDTTRCGIFIYGSSNYANQSYNNIIDNNNNDNVNNNNYICPSSNQTHNQEVLNYESNETHIQIERQQYPNQITHNNITAVADEYMSVSRASRLGCHRQYDLGDMSNHHVNLNQHQQLEHQKQPYFEANTSHYQAQAHDGEYGDQHVIQRQTMFSRVDNW